MTTKRHRERLHDPEPEPAATIDENTAALAREVAELADKVAQLEAKLDAVLERVAVALTAPAASPARPLVPAAKKLNGHRPLVLVPPPRPRRDLFDIGQDD